MINVADNLELKRNYFDSGATKSYAFRKSQLLKLKQSLLKYDKEIETALFSDLKKNPEEVWITETGFLIAEINHILKNLKKWMQPERVSTNLLNLPSVSYIYKEPLGVVLIIGPWNYPMQLLLAPLIGAIAAGNCAVLKPSEFAPATAAVIKKMIEASYPSEYISVVQGEGAVVIPSMMKSFRFNHVFYTGSTSGGRKIYQKAAEKLVPVTLELGGKSPCIVEHDANLEIAARRIAITKFSNAGQMCVAPDYLLVHASIKDKFIALLKKYVIKFYSTEPATDYHFGKLVNQQQWERLKSYLQNVQILHGGTFNHAEHYIEPTLVTDVSADSALMTEEIFGPILPVLTFKSFDEAVNIINKNPDPLAFYIFSGDRQLQQKWISTIPFGGGCINNVAWHLTNYYLPFGGRGNSGIGRYHGKYSFDVFTHQKAVMKTPTWFDPQIKYPPYKGKLSIFKKIIR